MVQIDTEKEERARDWKSFAKIAIVGYLAFELIAPSLSSFRKERDDTKDEDNLANKELHHQSLIKLSNYVDVAKLEAHWLDIVKNNEVARHFFPQVLSKSPVIKAGPASHLGAVGYSTSAVLPVYISSEELLASAEKLTSYNIPIDQIARVLAFQSINIVAHELMHNEIGLQYQSVLVGERAPNSIDEEVIVRKVADLVSADIFEKNRAVFAEFPELSLAEIERTELIHSTVSYAVNQSNLAASYFGSILGKTPTAFIEEVSIAKSNLTERIAILEPKEAAYMTISSQLTAASSWLDLVSTQGVGCITESQTVLSRNLNSISTYLKNNFKGDTVKRLISSTTSMHFYELIEESRRSSPDARTNLLLTAQKFNEVHSFIHRVDSNLVARFQSKIDELATNVLINCSNQHDAILKSTDNVTIFTCGMAYLHSARYLGVYASHKDRIEKILTKLLDIKLDEISETITTRNGYKTYTALFSLRSTIADLSKSNGLNIDFSSLIKTRFKEQDIKMLVPSAQQFGTFNRNMNSWTNYSTLGEIIESAVDGHITDILK